MRRNELEGFIMLNVYPQRATNPDCLPKECNELLHKQNLEHIANVLKAHPNSVVLVAFGDTIFKRSYMREGKDKNYYCGQYLI